jgi:hypothetical protein
MGDGADWSRSFRERKLDSGLKEVRNIWLPPEMHEALKKMAKELNTVGEQAKQRG